MFSSNCWNVPVSLKMPFKVIRQADKDCVLGVDRHTKGNKKLVRYVTILIRQTTKYVIPLQNLQVFFFYFCTHMHIQKRDEADATKS